MKTYSDKLKDARWQKKRLEILSRDEFMCRACFDTAESAEMHGETLTLHVHHTYYEKGREPWDYPNDSLISLCEQCHENERREVAERAEGALIKALKRKGFLSHDMECLTRSLELSERPQVAFSLEFAWRHCAQNEWMWRLIHAVAMYHRFDEAVDIVRHLQAVHEQAEAKEGESA